MPIDRYGDPSQACIEDSEGALQASKPMPVYQVNDRSKGCTAAAFVVASGWVMSAEAGPVVTRRAAKRIAIIKVGATCRRIVQPSRK